VVDSNGKVVKSIPGVSTSFAWSVEGNRLIFAKKDEIAHGSHVYDLYTYDLDAKKEKRLTQDCGYVSPRLVFGWQDRRHDRAGRHVESGSGR